MSRENLFFSYVIPANFSGQVAATLYIIDYLRKNGIQLQIIPLYPLRRSIDNRFCRWGIFLGNQLKIIPKLFNLLISINPTLHLTLGQSFGSFLRVAFWFFPLYFFKKNINVIISLNGSTFMDWEKEQNITKMFLSFLSKANVITVLGLKQKEKLQSLGVLEDRIQIVFNSSEIKPIKEEEIVEKQNNDQVINVLFLSLLVESKGFCEFLESAHLMASTSSRKINFVLCGPLAFTEYCNRFKTAQEKKLWIEEKIHSINKLNNKNVTIKWIPGAKGVEKEKLFASSHIFILPTYFPVEAQPLVLIEAMASGAAIITTKVGEIESILQDGISATMLEEVSSRSIADQIEDLIENKALRSLLAINALNFFNENLAEEIYFEKWRKIFDVNIK